LDKKNNNLDVFTSSIISILLSLILRFIMNKMVSSVLSLATVVTLGWNLGSFAMEAPPKPASEKTGSKLQGRNNEKKSAPQIKKSEEKRAKLLGRRKEQSARDSARDKAKNAANREAKLASLKEKPSETKAEKAKQEPKMNEDNQPQEASVLKDLVATRERHRLAADAGDGRSQHIYASMLMEGKGGPSDVQGSLKYWKLAAAQGDVFAISFLKDIWVIH
jgi:hypothetical protein